MSARITIPAEFKAIDKFSHVVKGMTKITDKFSKNGIASLRRFDHKITGTFKKLGNIGQMAIGLSIGAIFATAIQNNAAYNESLNSVASITGATGKNLSILEGHAMDVAKSSKMLGKDVLFAFENIASAQPQLLQTPKALAEITKHAITLSKASKLDLGLAADSLTTSLNQFGLGSEHALKAIDALSAGSVYGSSKIPKTADALAKLGTIAAATGTKLNESIALVQLVSPFEKGAEAGTKLKNILSIISGSKVLPSGQIKELKRMGVNLNLVTDASLPLNTRLTEFAKIGKDSNAVIKVMGRENAGLAQALFNNADGYAAMLENVNKTGLAQKQADKNMSSFSKRLENIKTSFYNTTTVTNSNNSALDKLGNSMDWVSQNMDFIVVAGVDLIAAYIVLKGLIWGTQTAAWAYSAATGFSAGVTGNLTKAIAKNEIALGAYKVAQMLSAGWTWIATGAMTAFGVAMNLGLWPILAIIAGIAALIAIFYYWDEITAWFGKQWEKFTSWIGEAWGDIITSFKKFNFIDFFKNIGQSILKFLLTPMTMMLKLVSNMPGKIGNMAQGALAKIEDITGGGEINVNDGTTALDSPEVKQLKSDEKTREALIKGSLNINLRDPGRSIESTETENTGIPINITNTQGAF